MSGAGRMVLLGTGAGVVLTVGLGLATGTAGHAAMLAAIGAVYLGTLIGSAPAPAPAAQEVAAAAATMACAALGLLAHPFWLVAGLVGHAGWDWAHHAGLGQPVARWYPPFCAALDLSAAAVLLALVPA